MLGDSHTALRGRAAFSGPRFPLQLYWWEDGLRVMATSESARAALGAKVIAVDEIPLEEIVERLGDIVVMENESRQKSQVAQFLVFPQLLYGATLINDRETAVFRVSDGHATKDLRVVADPSAALTARVAREREALTDPRPEWHWFEFLEEEGLLYVQYNRCDSSPEHDFQKFAGQVIGLCEQGKVRTLVFDVQYNGGGSSLYGSMLTSQLAQRSPLRERSNVFCVIGRRTFSSAVLNAMEYRNGFQVPLIGEPSGGSPNHFGEVRQFSLPHSGLQVGYSTKDFRRSAEPVSTIHPDHRIPRRFEDYVAGAEPLLDFVRQQVLSADASK